MMNHEESNRTLDTVEPFFLSSANERKLEQVSVERWRWDEPVITLTWVGNDHIKRNIHALVIQEDSSPCELLVEGNAWQDKTEDKKKMRYWQRVEVAPIQIPIDASQLLGAINEVYSEVLKWGTQDLKRKDVIQQASPGPARAVSSSTRE